MKMLLALSKNTFRETIRDRILFIIIFFAVIFILASKLAGEISARQDEKIIIDFGLAMINIFGVLITIFVGINLVHKELERRTIFILLSKPVSRSMFILSKFFGLGAVLFLITLFMGGIFFILAPFELMFVYAIGMMFVSFLLLLSCVLFFSSFMTPILAGVSALCMYVVGHITTDLKVFATYNDVSIGFKKFADFIYYIWPNFQALNLKNISLEGFVFDKLDAFYVLSMSVAFIVLFIFFGVLFFSKKEF